MTWDFVNSINEKSYKNDKGDFNPFIIVWHYSMKLNFIDITNDINKVMSNVTKDGIYDYLFYKIPKGKHYIKWPKKEPKEKLKTLEDIMLDYSISKEEAKKYMEIL